MSAVDRFGNTFYREFDCRTPVPRRDDEYRSPFQRDRDRIIYSSALRRLQAKTQVFLVGEYDFYRTRLTHSIEVAQIGRSICNYLRRGSQLLREDFFIDPDLVEAVCLAHDLGHPPFGHAGETTLNRMMADHGGFEGNAQTLRILTRLINSDDRHPVGMNPTRALMDGVMKYKTLIHELDHPERYFLYADQEKHLRFIFDEQAPPPELLPGKKRDSFRSIECQIMDWADDTAYSLNDIIDGCHARFITPGRVEAWAEGQGLNRRQAGLVQQMIRTLREGSTERVFSRKIGDFITACSLGERENFMSDRTNRYAYELGLNPEIVEEANLYKTIAFDLVFDAPELQQLKFKWNFILTKIFTALRENYVDASPARYKMVSERLHHQLTEDRETGEKLRQICDYLAGMTDGFAIRTYKRLFDPDFGSIGDLI